MFIKTQHTTVKRVEVKNTSTQTFGGFKAYLKLYFSNLELIKNTPKVTIFTHLNLLLQCVFKPLKQFYSYTTKINGCYSIINGNFKNESLKKIIIYKLFNLPIFVSSSELTNEDIKELLK